MRRGVIAGGSGRPAPADELSRKVDVFVLASGLLLFLGAHSARIVAPQWRARQVERFGAQRWKALYSIVAALGFGLIVWGYARERGDPVVLWTAPVWGRHLASALMLPAFVLWAAVYVPGTRIKATLGHPMVAGTVVWAVAHLVANGNLADLVLFGAFLIWAGIDFVSARARDRRAGETHPAGRWTRDALAVAAGGAGWAVFAFALHAWLIGVRPFA